MKRFSAFSLALAMMFILAACSHNDPYAVTLAADDWEYTEETVALPSEITFDGLTVCEGDAFDIKITAIQPDAPDGYILAILLANNTELSTVTKTQYIYETDEDGDKHIVGEQEITESIGTTYLIVVDSAVVNGTKVDVSFSSKVGAEDRAYDQIILDSNALESLGAITEIQLFFKVYISRDTDYLVSELSATVYPYGDPNIAE